MSDSFADLWASSAPTKSTPQQPQNKIGPTIPPRRQQYDAFSILSASQPSSKPVVKNQLSDWQAQRAQPSSRGGDAFSGLFTPPLDGTAASRHPDRSNMTIAERAVLTQKTKIAQSNATSAQTGPAPASSSLWEGLDVLARPTSASPRPHASTQGKATAQDSFDFAFDSVSVVKPVKSTSPPNNISIENDDWGLSELRSSPPPESRSAPAPTKPLSGSKPTTLWDLDEFGSSEPQTSPSPPRSFAGTPGDFDFGDREDSLLGGDNSDVEDTFGIRDSHSGHIEDDILGDLGKPVSHSHSPSPNPSTHTQGPAPPPRAGVSPPPHVTGQLVEMGFSPADARTALVNTATEIGFDVQAATELLLSQAAQEGSMRSSPRPPERERRRNGDRDRDRDRTARQPPPTPLTRADVHTQPSNSSQTHPQPQPQLDITTEKLLSQASEIGRGMFSKANALWKEGKERAVKMYEERAAANVASSASASDGRPRWMRDRDQVGGEWKQPDQTVGRNVVQSGFKDNENEGQGRGEREEQRPPARRPPQPQSRSQPPPQPEGEREVDLFSVDSPTTAYQSPFRRGRPKTQAQPPSLQSSLSAPILSTQTLPSTSQRPPQPPRTFKTSIVLSALATSTSHKSAGTDAYKRGDFPVALAAYMRALSALPPDHILRVPILTNVALVRSKVGELRDTIKTCEEAIVIIRRFVGDASGEGGDGGGETSFSGINSDFDEKTPAGVGSGKVSVTVQGNGNATSNGDLPTFVDLVEGLSKAYRRRAEALEGLEKWEMAQSTWEVLLGAEWAGAGVKAEAVKGVSRCRRMVYGGGTGDGPAPPKPKPNSTRPSRPKSKPTSKSTSPLPSAALAALRSTHDAQETEDAARLTCKDAVDARLTVWKSGREGNIRALLTSLDETILWPELGWRKVGLAEVVGKGQVKGVYMRAIARVHPDKLNTGNTTVEQRMIANGVFGALNEAWNVFQQQQQ